MARALAGRQVAVALEKAEAALDQAVADVAGLAALLHNRSVSKGNRLNARDAEYVDRLCLPVYTRARTLRTLGAAA